MIDGTTNNGVVITLFSFKGFATLLRVIRLECWIFTASLS